MSPLLYQLSYRPCADYGFGKRRSADPEILRAVPENLEDRNVELVRQLFDAVGRGDIEAALRFVGEDGEWVNPDNAMEPGTRRGLDGVRTALTALRDSFDDLRFELDPMVDLGDRVLVTGTFSGVGRTSGAGFGPQPFGAVLTIADGKVQRYQWYLDPDEARGAAGSVDDPQKRLA